MSISQCEKWIAVATTSNMLRIEARRYRASPDMSALNSLRVFPGFLSQRFR